MTEREQFEAAMSAYCDPVKVEETFYREGDGCSYESYATMFAWCAWQAARATAEQSRDSVIEECCAAIKAEDDREMGNGDYMLDSDDCIRVCRSLKSQQDAAIESQRSGDGS